MTATPLSPTDLDRLRAVVREGWRACAEAQGLRSPGDGRVSRGVGDALPKGSLFAMNPALETFDVRAYARSLEGLSRILEDIGYAIERHGSARIVTGWATVERRGVRGNTRVSDDVRMASLDPWDPLREAYDDRLHSERAERDALRRKGIGVNAKVEHAVAVNEMARRSR